MTLKLDRQLLNFIDLYRKFNKREKVPLEDDINVFLAIGVGKVLKIEDLKGDKPSE